MATKKKSSVEEKCKNLIQWIENNCCEDSCKDESIPICDACDVAVEEGGSIGGHWYCPECENDDMLESGKLEIRYGREPNCFSCEAWDFIENLT